MVFIAPPPAGKITYDVRWQQGQLRYEKAVRRARFLQDSEKDNWVLLGYRLTAIELEQAERVIVTEDLKRLKTRHQLSSLKTPKLKKNTPKRP